MSATASDSSKVSAEHDIWLVIFGELFLFTLFFATFLYYRGLAPELFEAARTTLHTSLGALNTVLLLTSSGCLAVAVQRLNLVRPRQAVTPWLAGTLACGMLFTGVKAVEYTALFNQGVNVNTNDFYMLYFMLTGIHLFHLLVGMVLLGALAVHVGRRLSGGRHLNGTFLGFSTSFWHMLDVVWIVLFPLLYLLR